MKVLRLRSQSGVGGVGPVYKTKLLPLFFPFLFFTLTPLLTLHRCVFCSFYFQKNILLKMLVQRFKCVDIPLEKSMSAEQAYGESGFGHSDGLVVIQPPSIPYHTRPDPLVPLRTQKHTAVEAFAARELGRRTVPRAKPVVAGSTEPIYTIVAGGAVTKVADSDDRVDGDGSMSPAGKSGNAAEDDDSTTIDNPGY